MTRSLLLLLVVSVFWVTPGFSAESAEDSAALGPGSNPDEWGADVIFPCSKGEPDFVAARQVLDSAGARIRALAPDADPAAEFEALTQLLKGRCFGLVPPLSGWPYVVPGTALSLQQFWEAGAEAWLSQFLEWDREPVAYSWTLPSLRKSLAQQTHPRHPLAPLLCPLAEAACGQETAGWVQRAESFFAKDARLSHRGPQVDAAAWVAGSEHPGCRVLAAEKPRLERWPAWMSCIQRAELSQVAFPLGKVKAPESGWLVVSGRRGHYSFCDEIRAYHLGTGTAFIVSSCSSLFLRSDGSVDGRSTDKARQVKARIGRLPVDAIREAAWMLFLSPELQEGVVLHGSGLALPPEVSPARLAQGEVGLVGLGATGSGSSGHTALAWSWVVAGKSQHAGKLTWPDDPNHAGYDHAVKLLQIAEANFVESCPRAALPSRLSDPKRLGDTAPTLIAKLRSLMATELCP